ncbi:hypothetical protein PM082_008292 [Marasmius tenuissimus]|nr:hypothetical protein PM082_008292 [Marasmius tenuissimus]
MCCNCFSLADPANTSKADHVDESLVATPLPDGYWIEAFHFNRDDKVPDIVAYGLGFAGKPASIKLFINPLNAESTTKGWNVSKIARLDFPVAMTVADLTGDGHNDVIICDRYGPSMGDLWGADQKDGPGGRIIWLRNPGNRSSQSICEHWEQKTIGNSIGMHSFSRPNSEDGPAGHFTTSEHVQVMGFPVIPKSNDLTSPAPVLVFTAVYGQDHSQGPESWEKEVAFDSQFRLIHDVRILPKTNGDLDMILVSGREGIVLLWFDQTEHVWKHNVVGEGIPQSAGNPYWGSGSVDVCRVGDDEVGYIATCEGFHGNLVAVYIKSRSAPKGAEALKDRSHWKRVVVDDFGPLNSESHTGTIHNVKAVQVPGSNTYGSFAIACMGVPVKQVQNQGVYVYTPSNLHEGHFDRLKVTNESAARLAVAGFSNSASEDIASISYYVPNYHTGPDPPSVRINTLGTRSLEIHVTRLNNEVLLCIPRPDALPSGQKSTLPFWILAGRKITLVVLRPGDSFKVKGTDAVKVIYGTITYSTKAGQKETRGIAPAAKSTRTTHVNSPITAGDKGAVFIHLEPLINYPQGPFSKMSDVSSVNILLNAPHVEPDPRVVQLPFNKVETLPWAKGCPGCPGCQESWSKFEFYNATGFHVSFNDDSFDNVVHIQAWTLGLGETARFHNHAKKSFCEIHYCLSNGGGNGGMRYFADNDQTFDKKFELTKEHVEKNSTPLVVPNMHEHGPLWKVQEGWEAKPKIRDNDTVDYPWHAWLASRFGEWELPMEKPLPDNEQKFDVWMAFEFPSTAFQY